jgi:hypothetical protein
MVTRGLARDRRAEILAPLSVAESRIKAPSASWGTVT